MVRQYIYVLDGAKYADQFYDKFIEVLQRRGNIVQPTKIKISEGIIRKREREAIRIDFGLVVATISALAMGTDLYVGYTIGQRKSSPDQLELQEIEAFSEYLINTIRLTLVELGATF